MTLLASTPLDGEMITPLDPVTGAPRSSETTFRIPEPKRRTPGTDERYTERLIKAAEGALPRAARLGPLAQGNCEPGQHEYIVKPGDEVTEVIEQYARQHEPPFQFEDRTEWTWPIDFEGFSCHGRFSGFLDWIAASTQRYPGAPAMLARIAPNNVVILTLDE